MEFEVYNHLITDHKYVVIVAVTSFFSVLWFLFCVICRLVIEIQTIAGYSDTVYKNAESLQIQWVKGDKLEIVIFIVSSN